MIPKHRPWFSFLYIYYSERKFAAVHFTNLFNIKKGNPEDGICRKGNALREDKNVT